MIITHQLIQLKFLRNKPVEKEFTELGELSIQVKKGIFSNQEEVVIEIKRES